jgi:hypothetical protein
MGLCNRLAMHEHGALVGGQAAITGDVTRSYEPHAALGVYTGGKI